MGRIFGIYADRTSYENSETARDVFINIFGPEHFRVDLYLPNSSGLVWYETVIITVTLVMALAFVSDRLHKRSWGDSSVQRCILWASSYVIMLVLQHVVSSYNVPFAVAALGYSRYTQYSTLYLVLILADIIYVLLSRNVLTRSRIELTRSFEKGLLAFSLVVIGSIPFVSYRYLRDKMPNSKKSVVELTQWLRANTLPHEVIAVSRQAGIAGSLSRMTRRPVFEGHGVLFNASMAEKQGIRVLANHLLFTDIEDSLDETWSLRKHALLVAERRFGSVLRLRGGAENYAASNGVTIIISTNKSRKGMHPLFKNSDFSVWSLD